MFNYLLVKKNIKIQNLHIYIKKGIPDMPVSIYFDFLWKTLEANYNNRKMIQTKIKPI